MTKCPPEDNVAAAWDEIKGQFRDLMDEGNIEIIDMVPFGKRSYISYCRKVKGDDESTP